MPALAVRSSRTQLRSVGSILRGTLLPPIHENGDEAFDAITGGELDPEEPVEKACRDGVGMRVVGPKRGDDQGGEERHPRDADADPGRMRFDLAVALVNHN